MNRLWYVFALVIILYYLKVPSIVSFIDGILVVVANVWNFTLDSMMNIRDRHPWIWISLPFLLLVIMSPQGKR